jgi:hypothetical protein
MADFCRECTNRVMGIDESDFKDIQTAEDTANGLVTPVLCEGCGFITVDHLGNKVEQLTEDEEK